MAYNGTLDEVSNRASWIDVIELRDQETNELIDFSTAQEIVVQVVSVIYDNYFRFGYGYGVGGYVGAPIITASLSNGQIVIISTGIFQFTFPRAMMNTLTGGDYNVGITIVKDDITTELFIGQVPVREGVVTLQAGAN
jgi:hypothetical protein